MFITLNVTCWVTSMVHRSITLEGPQPLRAGKSCQTLYVCGFFCERISGGVLEVVLYLFYGNFVPFNIIF